MLQNAGLFVLSDLDVYRGRVVVRTETTSDVAISRKRLGRPSFAAGFAPSPVDEESGGDGDDYDVDDEPAPTALGISPDSHPKTSIRAPSPLATESPVLQNAGLFVLSDANVYGGPPLVVNEMRAERLLPSFAAGPSSGFAPEIDDDMSAGDYENEESEPIVQAFEISLGARAEADGAPAAASPAPKARSNFPETWIWTDQVTDTDGVVTHTAEVPDTITSWVASAFALHADKGLGVAKDRSSLKVFKPFFASLNLPYSIKRLEKVALQVLVFNYDDEDVVVDVSLSHNASSANSFDFLDRNGNPLVVKPNQFEAATGRYYDNRNQRRITVPKGGAATVHFPIVATQVGSTQLDVTATDRKGAKQDRIKKYLKVEPEGFRVEQTNAELLELEEDSAPVTRTLELKYPDTIVEGSQFAQVAVIGDAMGPALQNPEGLIKMPYGCGEQNMVNFVPTIVVRRYLEVIERLTPAAVADARASMESGYQRQLSYMRGDGSFSAFGQRDPQGSTWLTAFVVKSFAQALPYVYIDRDVLSRSCRFLGQRIDQEENPGSVVERGEVHNKALMGGEGGNSLAARVSMSAYVLIAMQHCRNMEEEVAVVRGFVESNLPAIAENSYGLAIAALALQQTNSTRKEDAFRMLDARGVTSGGLRSWNYTKAGAPRRPWYWYQPTTLDVEASSYALLTYLGRGLDLEAAPIAKWLVRQQNPYGGYASTQDTVMAIQALGAFAERTYSRNTQLSVKLSQGGVLLRTIPVSEANAIVLQQHELRRYDAPLELEVSGVGKAFASLAVSFHLNPALADPKPFQCDIRPRAAGPGAIELEVACRYEATEEAKDKESNMVVVEVDALSGYVFDEERLNSLRGGVIRRTELVNADTHANIYLNRLGAAALSFTLSLAQELTVAEQKPARLVVYDYYDPEIRSELAYTAAANPTIQEACPKCWDNIPDVV